MITRVSIVAQNTRRTGLLLSVTVNNIPIQDYAHPDDHAPSTYS